MGSSVHLLVEVADDQGGGEQRERHVDEEDPPPDAELGEDPAEGRSDDRGDGPHRGDVALDGGPLGHGVDVARDGDRHRLDGAGAEALQGAERDQRGHAPGEAAEHGPDEEQRDARPERPPLPGPAVFELCSG